MAQLTLTVDDAQLPRWYAAYGVANNAQLKAAIISRVKQPLIDYELNEARKTEQVKIDTAVTQMDTALQTARTNAQAITIT